MRAQANRLTVGLVFMGPVALAAAQPVGPAVAGGERPAPARADEPQVQLKELGPATVVYLEHRGPYWRMGRLFSQVAEFAASHNQSGPMFARYLDDPAAGDAQGLRAEVGFLVSGPIEISEPYLQAEWPPRRVAVLIVRGHYGRAPAVYPRVLEWIAANGQQAAGPITEVYFATGSAGSPADLVTEIQVPLADEGSPEVVQGPPAEANPPGVATTEGRPELLESRPSADRQQVGVRLQALRRAVVVTYPRQAPVVDAYLGPLLAQPAWQDEQALAAPGYAIASGQARPDEAAQAALIARLDALLVNVTLGRLEPTEVVEQIAEVTGSVSEAAAAGHVGEQRR